jgi:hypothetical protein
MKSKVRTGRPPRLSSSEESNLYRYRQSGVAIKACASFFRVSVPTANRIIAKFRAYEERAEPLAREFPWRLTADASDRIAKLVTEIPGWDGYQYSIETQNELRQAAALLQRVIPLLKRASEREEVAHG